MNHLGWLIPIAAVLIYIINNLIRGSEDERPASGARSGDANRGSSGRAARRPTSDIDRFLDEVNRRRRQSNEPVPAPRPAVSSPTGAVRSTKSAATTKPPVARAASRTASSRAERSRKPVPVAVEEVVVATPVWEGPAEQKFPSAPPGPEELTSITVSPALAQLAALLKGPETLTTAFMLQEVLAKPRCRQHGLPGLPTV